MTVKDKNYTGKKSNKEITLVMLRKALEYVKLHEEIYEFPPLTQEEKLLVEQVLNFANNIGPKRVIGTYKGVKIIKIKKGKK